MINKIKQKATRGVAWNAVGNWGNQITSFIVFIVLTRLLDPTAFGLVGMAMVFVAFVNIFAEQGLGQAIVQRQDLEPEHLDTAFWMNLLLGAGLTLLGVLVSGLIATLYKEPLLQPVVAGLSFTFLATAFSSVQQALLNRNLEIRILAIQQLIAAIVGGVVGVVAALLGFGVYALVAKTLATGVIGALLLWRAGGWRPRWYFSWVHFRDLFHFGMNIVGIRITNFVRTRSDDFLIGYFLGAQALGYYLVAYRLARLTLDMFTGVIEQVAISTFSRLQDNSEHLRLAFMKVSKIVGGVTFPAFTGLILLAPDFLLLFSGEQWLPSVTVMRVLSIAGFTLTMQFVKSYLIIALGEPNRLLRINLTGTVITVVAFVFSARFGILYVAMAYTVVNMFMFGIYYSIAHRMLWFDQQQYLSLLLRPAIASVFMAMFVLLVGRATDSYFVEWEFGGWIRLILLILIGILTYGAGMIIMQKSLVREVRELVKTLVMPDTFQAKGSGG